MGIFNLSNDQASLEVIEGRVKESLALKGTNFLVLILAIFIASIGLNINSIPVIVGAMLISPLMGPIMGIGYYIVRNDFVSLKKSLVSLAQFFTLSVFISTIYFFLSPINVATTELLNRINPTIWDALIAFFGGIAGIVALTRKDFNNIFPGVAIATSLMPPLCTMGYGIAHLNTDIIINAFYLFFLNSFFIALATTIMLNLIHIPEIQLTKKTKLNHYFAISIVVFIILIPSIFKGKEIIQKEIFDVSVYNLVDSIKKNNIIVLSVETDKENKKLTLSMVEDEKIELINFKDFSSKYQLSLNLIKKQQNINVEQLTTQLRNEFLQKEKTLLEEINNNKNSIDLLELRKDLQLLNKNISEIFLNKEENIFYVLINKTAQKEKTNIEMLTPYIKEKTNNKIKIVLLYTVK
jgi:uncharacterized hydrophobic protein (TIGR00271 family)